MNNAFTLYGEPASNIVSDYVRQQYKDTCAIKSQQLILEKFGINLTEEQLRCEAMTYGWYTPGEGTSMQDVGKLLELHGVTTNQYVNGNIYNLVNELAQGHCVIMGVDSGELWHYGFFERVEDKFLGGERADHALIVSGIDTSNPNDVKVIITDPGTGDLCKEYSFAQFIDAAQDSNFFMVTTEAPEPNIFNNFGSDTQHLPYIGDMSYSYFRDHYAFLHHVDSVDLKSFQDAVNDDMYDRVLNDALPNDSDDYSLYEDTIVDENEIDEIDEIFDDMDFLTI